MKNSRRIKKEKGITLIALVVTIIAIVILAAIAINQISGDNGIINQSFNAKSEYQKKAAVEEIQLSYVTSVLGDRGTYSEEILEQELISKGATAITSLERLPITVKYKGFLITIKEDGNAEAVTWYVKNNKVTNGSVEIELGTTIKYNCGAVGSEAETTYTSLATNGNGYSDQTFDINSYAKNGANELTWKVLGVDNGQIVITPTTNIATSSNEQFLLYGMTGYVNGVAELDKISKLFAQGEGADIEKSRSIRAEDINKILRYNPEIEKYGKGTIYEYGNTVTYYWDGTSFPCYEGTNGVSGRLTALHSNFYWVEGNEYKTERPSIGAERKKIATIQSTYYEYVCSDYRNNVPNDEIYNLLFNTHDYWLGNQWVTTGTDYVSFDLLIAGIEEDAGRSLISSSQGETGDAFYIRPLVYLRPDIDISSMI